MKLVLLAIALTILGAQFAFGQSQTVTYQGLTLQPGDVINFYGGIFTTGGFLTYGHSALYLGFDPQTQQRVFLDFTTNERHFGGPAKKLQRAFVGRILPEKDFWIASARGHEAFDVFRLRDVQTPEPRLLLRAAKGVAIPDNWFYFARVCSNAVATVLTQATHTPVIARTPDAFAKGRFSRHPQLIAKIRIQDLMDEQDMILRERMTDVAKRSCANPGSITQAELNSLPRYYGENLMSTQHYPSGMGECIWVYIDLSSGVRNAEKLRTRSLPAVVIQAVPQPNRIVITATIPFESTFWGLKKFAITACQSSQQISLPSDFYQPRLPLNFSQQRDDSIANALSKGMGTCEKQFFYKLIETIRAGEGRRIDAKWVHDTVALYQPAPNPVPAPNHNTTTQPQSSGCFMQDNPFGPPYRVCPVP